MLSYATQQALHKIVYNKNLNKISVSPNCYLYQVSKEITVKRSFTFSTLNHGTKGFNPKALFSSYARVNPRPNEILGVERNATEKQVKTAYYVMAKKYHPDINQEPGANAKFAEAKKAYEEMLKIIESRGSVGGRGDYGHKKSATNSEPKPKKSYKMKTGLYEGFNSTSSKKKSQDDDDQFETTHNFHEFQRAFQSFIRNGKTASKYKHFQRFFHQFFINPESLNFEDIFQNEQEQSQMTNKELKRITINSKLNITIDQARKGVTKNIVYKKSIICPTCSGKSSDSKMSKCSKCGGSGFSGKNMSHIRACKACNGEGKVRRPNCRQCNNKGHTMVETQQQVTVPPNAKNNQQICLKGRGHQHRYRFYFGDLYIKLKISNKEAVHIDGMNTHSTIYVSVSQAMLGDVIEFTTLYGKRRVVLKKGTQDGYVEVIKDEGVKKGNKQGNHYLKVRVLVPRKVEGEERDLYEKLRDLKANKRREDGEKNENTNKGQEDRQEGGYGQESDNQHFEGAQEWESL